MLDAGLTLVGSFTNFLECPIPSMLSLFLPQTNRSPLFVRQPADSSISEKITFVLAYRRMLAMWSWKKWSSWASLGMPLLAAQIQDRVNPCYSIRRNTLLEMRFLRQYERLRKPQALLSSHANAGSARSSSSLGQGCRTCHLHTTRIRYSRNRSVRDQLWSRLCASLHKLS
jgi:hypothetical protein